MPVQLLLFAGLDAQQGIGRAVSRCGGGQGDNANPAPGGLWTHKHKCQKYNAHDGPNDTVCRTHIDAHDPFSLVDINQQHQL